MTAARRLPLPRNAMALDGLPVGTQVVVSFVGSTGYASPHVYADSGRRYEWGFLMGLHALIVIKPGIEVGDSLDAIFEAASPFVAYPAVVDAELKRLTFLVGSRPPKSWPVKEHTSLWREYFS